MATIKGVEKPCYFPFKYTDLSDKLETYNKCTKKDVDSDAKPWCSTGEESSDENYGDCSENCIEKVGTYCEIIVKP